MHRADTQCHWCGEVKGVSLPTELRVDRAVWRSAAAVALMVTAVGGVWRYAPMLKGVASSARAAVQSASVASGATNSAVMVAQSSASSAAGTIASPSVAAALPSTDEATPVVAPTSDEIQWTPAVARTWVNVRSDASRGGEVVGVIKPASRAMLGTDRAGWRQVRSPDVSGWVDPRLFEPDSLRTRGGT